MLPRSLLCPSSNHYSPSLTSRPDLLCVFFLITWFGFRTCYACHSHCCRDHCVKIQLIYPLRSSWPFESFLLCGYYISCHSGPSVTQLWPAYGSADTLLSFFPFLKRCIYFFIFGCGESSLWHVGLF